MEQIRGNVFQGNGVDSINEICKYLKILKIKMMINFRRPKNGSTKRLGMIIKRFFILNSLIKFSMKK